MPGLTGLRLSANAAMLCAAIFVAALLLRLIGLDWHGAHPDENPGTAAKVLSGQLSVASYYPPLLDYLTAAAFAFLYVAGRVLRWWRSVAEFRSAYFADPAVFLVTGRIVVATLSATLAPLVFVLLRSSGAHRRLAALGGIAAALVPGSVFWARIAKSDVALAPAYLALTLAAFHFVDDPTRVRRALLLAAAISIAVSVKQSAVFFALPLLLLLFALSLARSERRAALALAWGRVALFAAAMWIPLNIGIVLDPDPFIAAQRVQGQMSVRPADLQSTLATFATAATSLDAGLPVALIGLWLLHPLALLFAPPRGSPVLTARLLVLFAATASAILIVGWIAGTRQPSYLWLPHTSLMAVSLICAAVCYVADREQPGRQWIGAAVLAVVVTIMVVRLVPILQQSLMPPQAAELADAVRRSVPPDGRVLSAMDLSPYLPVSADSARETRGRHERLARKYGVDLPAAHAPVPARNAHTYTLVPLPVVIGGLEDVAPGKVRTVIAYAWPLQPEEWTLDHWRAERIRFFILHPARLHDPVPAYRSFHREVARRCNRLATIPGRRPLFGENAATIYRCDA